MTEEIPNIQSYNPTSTTMILDTYTVGTPLNVLLNQELAGLSAIAAKSAGVQIRAEENLRARQQKRTTKQQTQSEDTEMKTTKRIVQIFIVDQHPDVPQHNAILYQSEKPFLTEATDQELYFGIAIKDLVDKHNLNRTGWKDKEASRAAGRDVNLEPVRIRDLGMVVSVLAQFN